MVHKPTVWDDIVDVIGTVDATRHQTKISAEARTSGKALYAAVSNYTPEQTQAMADALNAHNIHLLIHQPSYNMLNRWVERDGLKDTLRELGVGSIAFTPLAQGMLTKKYLNGIPQDSRAAQDKSLDPAMLSPKAIESIRALDALAQRRGQTLAQMAIAWVLRPDANGGAITSALIGASRPSQVEDCAGAVGNLDFTAGELAEIDALASEEQVNLWAKSAEL